MHRILALLLGVGCLTSTLSAAAANNATPAGAPIVFFDIAAPEMAKQSAFYSKVFGWNIRPEGGFAVSVLSPLGATLRQDPKDKIIYLGVNDITATLAKIEANGGKIVEPRFEVKGVVILGLFEDPAGNRMGLVEMADGKPKVP